MADIGRRLFLLVTTIALSVSCLLPTEGDLDDQVDADTPPPCHTGTFECTDGPDVTLCGTWSFDVNTDDTITGQGQITLPGGETVPVTLTGVIDQGVEVYELVLTSDAGGHGEFNLTYDGPELTLSGTWSFVTAPEPAGDLIEGGLTGTSCTDLRTGD